LEHDVGPNVGARLQRARRVAHGAAHLVGARLGIHAVAHALDLRLERLGQAFDVEPNRVTGTDRNGPRLRDREHHFQSARLLQHDDRVGPGHRAFVRTALDDASRVRRRDPRALEIALRSRQARLHLRDPGARDGRRGAELVVVLLGGGALRDQVAHAFGLVDRVLALGARQRQPRARLRQRHLVGIRVDAEQRLPLLDRVSDVDEELGQTPADLGADLGLAARADRARRGHRRLDRSARDPLCLDALGRRGSD
jgi:hypothetical protein